jgi:hypothetical protein
LSKGVLIGWELFLLDPQERKKVVLVDAWEGWTGSLEDDLELFREI